MNLSSWGLGADIFHSLSFFCVGVSASYGIITRLDRLMVAAKEIVGEQYHIHGIGLGPAHTKGADSDFGARAAVHFRPPQDV